MREEIQQRLELARAVADDPAAVFCIQPFTSVGLDGGERLGKFLARVMADPDNSLVVATATAFVFAFKDQPGQTERDGEGGDGTSEVPA